MIWLVKLYPRRFKDRYGAELVDDDDGRLMKLECACFGTPDSYITALSINSFYVPYLFSMRYTSLKGRSSAVQWTFMVGLSVALVLLSMLAGWIGGR